jgi:hypothetical protein
MIRDMIASLPLQVNYKEYEKIFSLTPRHWRNAAGFFGRCEEQEDPGFL